MIRTLVKLALAALIANAVWRVGSEYVTDFKFRDAVRETAIFKARSDEELRAKIGALASQFDVPIDEDSLTIDHQNNHLIITGGYEKPIELLPGYQYPWHFSWTIDAELVQPKPGAR